MAEYQAGNTARVRIDYHCPILLFSFSISPVDRDAGFLFKTVKKTFPFK